MEEWAAPMENYFGALHFLQLLGSILVAAVRGIASDEQLQGSLTPVQKEKQYLDGAPWINTSNCCGKGSC